MVAKFGEFQSVLILIKKFKEIKKKSSKKFVEYTYQALFDLSSQKDVQ